MLIRAIRSEEKEIYNRAVEHPLQSWEWGEFRHQTGQQVTRLGVFDNGQLTQGLQVTFHKLPIPGINKNIGYFPKGPAPNENQLSALKQLATQYNAIFIKLEPNIMQSVENANTHRPLIKLLQNNGAQPGRLLFTRFTFHLDLTQTEDTLFSNLKSKTRYNVNLAHRKGVKIYENSSPEGVEQYLEILAETTSRQGFYAHHPDYFRQMWSHLGKTGMMRIFNAVYDNKILVSWIMFMFNDVLYYPYGASRHIHRNVMAGNLLMWEMIRFGKESGCHTFDLWGSLGPEPDKDNPWYGFHRFKEGYGGQLMQSLGTHDLVANQSLYTLFRLGDSLRWKWLRLKIHLPF